MSENTITIVLDSNDVTGKALVATIKAAVNGDGKYAAYVAAHGVTRETIKDHAYALAVLAYPNEAPVQKKDGKRTKFGNAVQKVGAGLRNAITPEDSDEDAVVALLTKAGKSATLEQVTAAWTAAQS